jgi:hypothetical protein
MYPLDVAARSRRLCIAEGSARASAADSVPSPYVLGEGEGEGSWAVLNLCENRPSAFSVPLDFQETLPSAQLLLAGQRARALAEESARGSAAKENHPALPRSTPTPSLPQNKWGRELRALALDIGREMESERRATVSLDSRPLAKTSAGESQKLFCSLPQGKCEGARTSEKNGDKA